MRTLKKDQRVVVRCAFSHARGRAIDLHAEGTVGRIRTDGSAFVALDRRSRNEAVHPFPAGDEHRGRYVIAYPEDCDPAEGNRPERRAAARVRSEAIEGLAVDGFVPVVRFGRDHWSTLAYLETRCVDGNGEPDRRRMRCDPERHPILASYEHAYLAQPGAAKRYPTRLRDGVELHDHDDWDCALDLETAGLLEQVGTGANPVYRMTDDGFRICAALRRHRAEGGSTSTFSIEEQAPIDTVVATGGRTAAVGPT